ncbi:MAG TPA: TRAP transporter large permease [Casimicrobiaceae bacterium]|jgi:C4-dicarboxylate transporter DctM subunit|nr:TRAP transporter large permease [Casimicrobiaceae bacterium]
MLPATIVSFAILILSGMPIAWALGLAAAIGLAVDGTLPLSVIAQRMVGQIDTFALLAVPFFVLAGELMDRGGVSTRLVRMVAAFIGHLRGGLGMVCVISSFIFAGISASSAADAAAIGAILIPAMIRRGYNAPFAASLQAAAATMGPIVPPSTLAIIYASITGVSVGALFIAGIVPGALMAIALVLYARITGGKMEPGGEQAANWQERLVSVREAGWALFVPVIILGGIFSGVFTATESGAIAVAYALFVGLVVYREIKLRDLPDIFVRASLVTGMVMIVLSTAGIFAWILVTQDLPRLAGEALLAVSRSPAVVLFLIIVFMLFVGMVMEIVAAGIIMIPILFPIAHTLGFDDVHFAMVIMMTMALGAITPPVGVTLFITLGLSGATLSQVNRYIWPVVGVLTVVLFIVAYVPSVSMFLPRALSR